jgi:rhodanese-related sulfurtransferase
MSLAAGQLTAPARRLPHEAARAAELVPWSVMTHPFHAEDVDVDPDRARALIEAEEVQLVDVREPHEWEAGRIAGARHIEIERLASEAGTLDRDRPVLFYCRLGARSGMAANAFRRAGFDAYSVDGGLTEWDRRGFPLEPEDGTVADH